MKRRWPVVLLGGVLLLFSIAVLVTLLSARSIEGAVPGRAPLLGLAVSSGEYLVGAETGVFLSPDAKRWSKPGRFSGAPALVTGVTDQEAVILSAGKLVRTTGGGHLSDLIPDRISGTAIATSAGSLYVARNPGTIQIFRRECLAVPPRVDCASVSSGSTLRLKRGPDEILTLDAAPGEPPVLFAGGLRTGVWRTSTPEQRWRRVLETPTRAVMVDDRDPKRIYIGTAGGLLLSEDQGRSWDFTALRQPVEALAQAGGELFALGGDRLIYESSDGETWKVTIAP